MARSRFFEEIRQTQVAVDGKLAAVPCFIYDASMMTAVFLARYGALRKLLPDPRFVPARLAPGLGLVAVSAIEYRETDVGPYNELSVSVPLNQPPCLANLPGRALATARRRRQYHTFILSLPVTTEAALAGGVVTGFPKSMATIEFAEDDRGRACRVSEGAEHVLTLRGPKIPTPRSEQMQAFVHVWMDRQPQSTELKINALEVGETFRPGAASVELSRSHPIAAELAQLIVWQKPVHFSDMPRFEMIEYGPDRGTLPLLVKGLELVREAELVGAS